MMRWLVWLLPTTCLAVALLDMPYGYYQLLRVLIFCMSFYLAFSESQDKPSAWFWGFLFFALAYNPIFRLSLGRDIWAVVNVVTAAYFTLHFWIRGRQTNSNVEARS